MGVLERRTQCCNHALLLFARAPAPNVLSVSALVPYYNTIEAGSGKLQGLFSCVKRASWAGSDETGRKTRPSSRFLFPSCHQEDAAKLSLQMKCSAYQFFLQAVVAVAVVIVEPFAPTQVPVRVLRFSFLKLLYFNFNL